MQRARTYMTNVFKDIRKQPDLYIIVLPVIVYYIIFHYGAMWGTVIAFKDFSPGKGILGSPWTGSYGFEHFIDFFNGFYFWRLLKNTLTLSTMNLLLGFPMPIILALMINELRNKTFTRTVQTITYMPHFISLVVICGMVVQFTRSTGFLTQITRSEPALNMRAEMFPWIYVLSTIWQEAGWGTIIYLSALAGIDQEIYEAARIDGAGRWKQTLYVTLPGILPTVIIMFILRLGNILNVGFERVILLYNPAVYSTADVFSSYVYREGLELANYSKASAVGLFNSAVTFVMVIVANNISRKVSDTSLW